MNRPKSGATVSRYKPISEPLNVGERALAAAKTICGADPPVQLVSACELIIQEARQAEELSSGSSSRSEARALLEKLSKCAREAAAIIDDARLKHFYTMLTAWKINDPSRPESTKVLLTSARLSWLADDADWLIEHVPTGPGSNKLHDALGGARGRLVAAVGVVRLFEIVKGAKPSKTSVKAQEAWDYIWGSDDPDAAAAERHLMDALRGVRKISSCASPSNNDAIIIALMAVSRCLERSNLQDAYPPIERGKRP